MSERALTKTVKIGRYDATMTLGRGGFVVEWNPLPPRNSLSDGQIKKYKKARRALIVEAQLAGVINTDVLVVDV